MTLEVFAMKKLLCLFLLAILLLTGCMLPGMESGESSEPTETTEETTAEITQPSVPWIEELGMPWDEDGTLLEIPLTIPDGLHYSGSVEFDGDLLLWSMDHHLADTSDLELCLIDLGDGSVIAQRDIPFSQSVVPQVLGSSLYLCEYSTGTVYRLDRNLLTLQIWQTEPMEGNWYMGAGEKLYIYNWDSSVYVRDLATGETAPLLDGDPPVQYMSLHGETVLIEYYRADTGAKVAAALDLMTGELYEQPVDGGYETFSFSGGSWLLGKYREPMEYTLCPDGAEPVCFTAEGENFEFLDGKYLFSIGGEDSFLSLYDLDGNLISRCRISGQPYSFYCDNLIWSKEFGGYFCTINSYDGNQRLLFWDITKGTEGEDLVFSPMPEPSEMEARTKQRAQELSEKYGLMILVGDECDTVFDEFTASIVEDWDLIDDALDTLERALSVYPQDFFRQLRWDTIYSIRIHLISDLMADGSGRYGAGYSAFTQSQWDHYLMVIDIEDSLENTYYHEFSHIIDSFLEWDSWQREDARFSEETWNSLNPSWFTGYSYDYSREHALRDWTSFVDTYATISPTEDRARVMEYAMADFGQWTFEDADILLAKLNYYCLCIRDAFDTEDWPEVLLWEQYLH